MVDFSNASLYLSGIQTVFSICTVATVSVLACWLVPATSVSAVRTLVLCVAAAVLLMRKPLRVGRARGVHIVFAALQPAVAIYLLALIIEQLTHTCTGDAIYAPSWRRVVFHTMVLVMLASGMMRARSPMLDTDLPFLMTAAALLVIALMPPPGLTFSGPLCERVGLWEAADRLVRAFTFASVYCVHVYAMTPSTAGAATETLIVVTRSAAAALWTVGVHPVGLVLAVVQCAVVILSRLRLDARAADASARGPASYYQRVATSLLASNEARYEPLPAHAGSASDGADDDDLEAALGGPGGLESPPPPPGERASPALESAAAVVGDGAPAWDPPPPPPPEPPGAPSGAPSAAPTFGPVAFREIGGPGSAGPSGSAAGGWTAERMAEIAATIPD
jgi:hypothetical protein